MLGAGTEKGTAGGGAVSPAAVQQYLTADDVLTGLIIFLGTTFLCP